MTHSQKELPSESDLEFYCYCGVGHKIRNCLEENGSRYSDQQEECELGLKFNFSAESHPLD